MKITINPFDGESIASAIEAIQKYRDDIEDKEKKFVERLAEIGVQVAGDGYSVADSDGINDVKVSVKLDGSSAAIIAEGKTVGFIEFGTGVRYREYNSAGLEYTPPAHGTYGKGRGKNPKGWFFSNSPGSAQHTYGNPPAEVMLTTRDEIISQIVRVAREVWR